MQVERGVAMRKPGYVVAGLLVAAAGLVFTLQGVGVLKGSSMSNTTFWAVAGPVIMVVGLALARVGARDGTR
jgi:xanthine/uracil permease